MSTITRPVDRRGRPHAARRPIYAIVQLLLALLGTATCTGTASAAGIVLRDAAALPMGPRPAGLTDDQLQGGIGRNLVCTAEPRNQIYGNVAYDPTKEWDIQQNNPSVDDLDRDLQAGKSSDWCLGYTLTPNVEEMVTGATYADDHAWRVQPAGAPFPDEPDTHGYDMDAEKAIDGDDMRDIEIDLPPGFAASPVAAATCTEDQFHPDDYRPIACSAASQVGDANVRISLAFGMITFHGPLEIGKVFNLPAGPNEVARLGVMVVPPATMIDNVAQSKFTVRVTMAADGSGRLRAIVKDAPRRLYAADEFDANGQFLSDDARNTWLGLYIESVGMRIWGSKADHPTLGADFAESGTTCQQTPGANVRMTTYKGRQSSVSSPGVTLTGCDQLPFSPSVDVATTEHRPGVPTGATIDLRLGQTRTASGLRPALLKGAAITLPAGLELGAQVGTDGLPLCAAAQFARTSLAPAACPAGSDVGTVAITSPLIDRPLQGKVYLGEQPTTGALPQLFVDASFPGATAADAPRIKLAGTVVAGDDGRLTATFADNPQLRFDRLSLTLRGGKNAVLVTPRACGTATSRSLITPSSGKPAAVVESSLRINEGCAATAFAPTVEVTPLDAQSGKKAATRITIARTATAPWIRKVAVHLPAGFLADLGAVAECASAQAAAGNCSDDSRIATVKVLAGAGDSPVPLTGAMYLSARGDGDVAGVVLVTRAKIGDLDLGDVVVPGRIALRPTDAGLDFVAEVPLRFKGVALQLQRIDVTLDRAGFALNPSACGPLGFTSEVTGDGGESAAPAGSVSYTGCSALPFRPTLKATLTGDNTPGGHPGMFVRLESPEGDAGMRSASVTLPQGVSASLPNVKNPCPLEDFGAVRCAASTRVGSAVAHVSITPEAIRGEIFLIKVPGKTLPGLGLSFTGRYAQRVTSTVEVNKEGRLVTNFGAIPDLPLRSLEIQVDSSSRSPLQLPSEGACAGGSNWDGTFVGQGGQTASAKTGLQCAASANARLSDKRGFTLRLFDFGGRKLSYVKATLPAGWRFDTKAAKRKGAFWVRMSGSTPKVRLTARSLTAFAGTGTATDVRVKIGGRVVRPMSAKSRTAKSVAIPLRLAFTDGTVQMQTLTIAAR